MASRSSSWLALTSLLLACGAAGASCSKEKERPPSLSDSTSTTTATGVTVGAGGSGGDATGGAGGTGGSAGATGTGGFADSCSDKEKDNDETDIDCGGACAPCGANKACLMASDCESKSCPSMLCVQATCSDAIENQSETDIDCGGGGCVPCPATKKCKVSADCQSTVCTAGHCVKEACNDGVKNGNETDIDCGGGGCPDCGLNKMCAVNNDCVTANCTANGGISACACPGGMVVVPINGGGAYCMDATEVTYSQYQSFHSAGVLASTQPAACVAWNQNFTPTGNGWSTWIADGKGSYPVTSVNWCDAYMYCQFEGKRLCGKIGGGTNVPADYASAEKSEWFNACSAQGNNIYPYGNGYVAGTCNGENCTGTLAETDMKLKLCQGGQPMLQQMSGNAAEWEDSCDANAGQSDACRVRGGSDCSNATDLRCDADSKKTRGFADDHTGFRCCL